MSRDDKNQIGVSLFNQGDVNSNDESFEELFALNLGDFISESFISEDLAKKISVNISKKQRLQNQLSELIEIYSSNNILSVLNLSKDETQAVYSSIANSIIQMVEVEECAIYLLKDDILGLVGGSISGLDDINKSIDIANLIYEDLIVINEYIFIPMKSSVMPVGVIALKALKNLEEVFSELVISIANLLGTTITLLNSVDYTNEIISKPDTTETELKQERAELTAIIGDLCDYQQCFVEDLANAVDAKGQYKNPHSRTSAKLARKICKKLGLNEKTTDLIYYAGLLQNIGKITLPERIFATNGKLSQEELDMIKKHTSVGVNLLMNINFLAEVVPYIIYQSERVDGSGSPEGLKGQSIPLGSRIIAVSDAYSAMTSDRPYRKAMESNKAYEILSSEAGIKWDKDVIKALGQIINE